MIFQSDVNATGNTRSCTIMAGREFFGRQRGSSSAIISRTRNRMTIDRRGMTRVTFFEVLVGPSSLMT
jgi:hypothetical protein